MPCDRITLLEADSERREPSTDGTAAGGGPQASLPSTPASSSGSTDSRAHVLVVEDDPASGRMMEAKLAAAGHLVTLANGSAEAQELVMANRPDLIVSDVCMPDMDGIELTRWLRAQEQTAAVPVALFTAVHETQLLQRGLDSGADDFIFKPVNTLELHARVRSLLRHKNFADELIAREKAAGSFGGTCTVQRPDGTSTEVDVNTTVKPQPEVSTSDPCSTVLIVEDNEKERRLLELFLEDVRCQVQSVADGSSAWAVLQQDPPDMVVLDLILPDMNGYELIQKMRSDPRLTRIPILVVTVMSDVGDRVKALNLGADDFIAKGFERIEFKARVQRLLRLKQSIDLLADRCDQAMRRSVTDSLTGLLTHGFLQDLLQRELPRARRHNEPLSLIFGDIDHFKQINDRFGHVCGDRVLKAVAGAIHGVIRASDSAVRFGGDEFVVLMPRTDQEGARNLAERIRSAVEALTIDDPFIQNHDKRRVTVSLGCASFPDDATDVDSLLHHADEAAYAAKQCGRNCVTVFGEEEAPAPQQSLVLIVDDEEKNLRLLEAHLEPEGYQLIKAANGEEALEMARRSQPDLILLDAMMPRMHGFDVCRRLKQEAGTRLIPVVLVTALSGREDKLRGIEAGADEFLTKPVNRAELVTRARALLRSKRATDLLEDAEAVIFTLARAVEDRDPSTGGHVERVSHYATEMGKMLGLPESQVEALRRAGVVHDVGKIAVPDGILLKKGALTDEERRIMQRHVDMGHQLLKPLRTFAEARQAVRFHHERLDGSGYPLGLRGDHVPLVAQILAIVDVYDALITNRPYRAAMSSEKAIEILRDEAARGLHDPKLVEKLIQLVTSSQEPLPLPVGTSAGQDEQNE